MPKFDMRYLSSIACLGWAANQSCSGGGHGFSPFGWLGHQFLHGYDWLNNTLAPVDNALIVAGQHTFVQLQFCLFGCISATIQGNQLIVSSSFPTLTFWRHPSDFLGINMGVTTATPQETEANNRSIGGGLISPDGVGGGGMGSAHEGRNGLGPVHIYGFITFGEGVQWQFGGGASKSWSWNIF
jgi:hypothetical protein